MAISVEPIGIIHSCFRDKFGVPRQPGLVEVARARLELFPPYDNPGSCLGLEGNSHLWITFVFHHSASQPARLTVRPPRLGGNRRIGVFASRSTHRPNPVGLSVVELEGVEERNGHVTLQLKGVDLVDGTPVLDVRPYLPSADALPGAQADYAQEAPAIAFKVHFSPEAEARCRDHAAALPELRGLIEAVLALDPRPAYHAGKGGRKRYVVNLHGLDISWSVVEGVIEVYSITAVQA